MNYSILVHSLLLFLPQYLFSLSSSHRLLFLFFLSPHHLITFHHIFILVLLYQNEEIVESLSSVWIKSKENKQ